jgi:hypothetical protein
VPLGREHTRGSRSLCGKNDDARGIAPPRAPRVNVRGPLSRDRRRATLEHVSGGTADQPSSSWRVAQAHQGSRPITVHHAPRIWRVSQVADTMENPPNGRVTAHRPEGGPCNGGEPKYSAQRKSRPEEGDTRLNCWLESSLSPRFLVRNKLGFPVSHLSEASPNGSHEMARTSRGSR